MVLICIFCPLAAIWIIQQIHTFNVETKEANTKRLKETVQFKQFKLPKPQDLRWKARENTYGSIIWFECKPLKLCFDGDLRVNDLTVHHSEAAGKFFEEIKTEYFKRLQITAMQEFEQFQLAESTGIGGRPIKESESK